MTEGWARQEKRKKRGAKGGKGHSPHNFGCIFYVDFLETIPNDITVFNFPNLNLTTAVGRVFVCKQVKVFIVNLNEGALETKVPSASSFLPELLCTRKNRRYSPRDDTHTVLRSASRPIPDIVCDFPELV